MLSAAIHYATLKSFRSIKLPSSLYKPPVLMLAPTAPWSRGILLQSRRHRALCTIYWAAARWTVGDVSMHELVRFSFFFFLIQRKWRSSSRLSPIFFLSGRVAAGRARCRKPDVGRLPSECRRRGILQKRPERISSWRMGESGFFNGWQNQSRILPLAQSRLLNASTESYFVRSPSAAVYDSDLSGFLPLYF